MTATTSLLSSGFLQEPENLPAGASFCKASVASQFLLTPQLERKQQAPPTAWLPDTMRFHISCLKRPQHSQNTARLAGFQRKAERS